MSISPETAAKRAATRAANKAAGKKSAKKAAKKKTWSRNPKKGAPGAEPIYNEIRVPYKSFRIEGQEVVFVL